MLQTGGIVYLSDWLIDWQVLQKGDIGEQPPVPSVTDSMLRANELREGTVVGLDQQVTCSVAFSQGEERRVFFAIHGLPQVPFLTDCALAYTLFRGERPMHSTCLGSSKIVCLQFDIITACFVTLRDCI